MAVILTPTKTSKMIPPTVDMVVDWMKSLPGLQDGFEARDHLPVHFVRAAAADGVVGVILE